MYIFIILLGAFCFNVSAFSAEQKAASYPEDVDTQEILDDEYSPEDIDIEKMYRDLPVPDFKYMHNIDPGEYQDTMYSTWSPYPLFRLTAPLFSKQLLLSLGIICLHHASMMVHGIFCLKRRAKLNI